MRWPGRASLAQWLPFGVAVLVFCGYWLLDPCPWSGWEVARSLLLATSLGVLCTELSRSAGFGAALASVALIGFSPTLLAGGEGQAGWSTALRFAIGVFAFTLARRGARGWTWAVQGALVGWLAWARPTDIALLLVPLAFLARSRVRVLAVMGTACAAVWLLGYLSGETTPVAWSLPAPLDAFWSPRGGLLYWQPILWLSILALLAGFRRRPVAALCSVAPLLLLGLWPVAEQDLARWVVILPPLTVALARPLDGVVDLARRRPGVILAGAGLVLLISNRLLMAQYREPSFPRDQTVSFVDLEEGNARILASTLGSPLTWPASWVFAWRSGLPAFRYEYVAGRSLFGGRAALGGRLDVGEDLPREAILLGEGWGVRHVSSHGLCREALAGAEIFAPLAESARLDLSITASGSGAFAIWRDEVKEAELPVGADSSQLRVPALRLPRGLTVFRLEPVPGSTVCVARWDLVISDPSSWRTPAQN